jgi:hypothetical protein
MHGSSMLPKKQGHVIFFLSCFVTRKIWLHWHMDDCCFIYIAKLEKKKRKRFFFFFFFFFFLNFLGKKLKPVLDNFVTNSMTFKKENTKK